MGEDQLDCVYNGGSVIVDAYGRPVVVAPDDAETVIMADIDMQKLSDYRAKFPSLGDSDVFEIIDNS